MDKDLIEAVKQLVDAVGTEHCIPIEGDEALMNEQRTVERARAVLRKVRAMPELSSLHSWAENTANLMSLPAGVGGAA
jgi:hypothetical protein